VSTQVDVERVLAIAGSASRLGSAAPQPAPIAATADVRVGIARDSAFGFYYPADLDAFRRAGAELISIDTLRQRELPDVDGLFIGGGFPETHMLALEGNRALRASMATAIDAGLPVYAECGGLMYLARSLTWNGRVCRMVGAIPADVLMHERPMGRGYVRLQETANAPWPLCEGQRAELSAHEFHHSSVMNLGTDVRFAYRVLRGTGVDGEHDGIVYKNVLASYAHLRDVDQNHWVARFVGHVRACKRRRAPSVELAGLGGSG
jgi:cobyrinic acid a,c-diamide synthase